MFGLGSAGREDRCRFAGAARRRFGQVQCIGARGTGEASCRGQFEWAAAAGVVDKGSLRMAASCLCTDAVRSVERGEEGGGWD